MWNCDDPGTNFDPPQHYANCGTLIEGCVDASRLDPPVPLQGSPYYNAIVVFAQDVGNACTQAYNFIVDGGFAPHYNPTYLNMLRGTCATLQNDATFLGNWESNSAQAMALYSIMSSVCCNMDDPFNMGYAPIVNPFLPPDTGLSGSLDDLREARS